MYDVDPATGLVCLEAEDWSVNGDIPLFFTRRYNNLTEYTGAFGSGWMHAFGAHLILKDGELQLVDSLARSVVLPGLWSGHSVRERSDGYVAHVTKAGFVVFDAGGSKLTFSSTPDYAGRFSLVRKDETGENSLWFFYDHHGLAEVQSNSGHRILFRYSTGRVRELVAANQDSVRTLSTYEYDSKGDLIAVLNSEGKAVTYECTGGLITRTTNRLGGSVFFEYDAKRRCTRTWQHPFGRYRSVEYDDQGRRALVTDSTGQRTRLAFNENGLLVETLRFDGSVAREFYGNGNEAIARDGGPQAESQYTYDPHGNITEEVEPDGAKWKWNYDSFNRMTREESPDGAVQEFDFDDLNHIVRQRDERGGVVSRNYDEAGRLVAEVLPLGNRVQAERVGASMRVSDALGPLYETREDLVGNVAEIRNATGSLVRFEHDPAGRIVAIARNGHRATNSYDAEGNLAWETDFAGQVTSYRRDSFSRLLGWTSPLGVSYSYEYDVDGRLTAATSSAGAASRFDRDWQGRLTKVRLRDGREESYSYDENGNRKSVVDSGGLRTEYNYTPAGLVSGIRQANSSATFAYDAMGNLTEAQASSHSIKRTTGPGETVRREEQDDFAVDYEYNAAGLVTKRSDTFGRVTCYEYNVRGQLVALRDSCFGEFQFRYDSAGSLLQELFPNGLIRQCSFDAHDELSNVVTSRAGTSVGQRSYHYDANGELIRETYDQDEFAEFAYNAGRQLTRVQGRGTTEESFVYDNDENIIGANGDTEFRYDGGRLYQAGPLRYEYDNAGRVIRRIEGSQEYRFEYGLGGLISKAVLPDGSVFDYGYDGLGRRVLKRGRNETIRYFWDADTLLAETRTKGKATETRFYLYLPDTFIPIAHSVDDKRFYYDVDQRGAVREVYDQRGAAAARFRYRAFGAREGSVSDSTADCPFRLLGQYFDDETGLHYNRFRYFDPVSARFLSVDLWSHEVETNPYSYGPNPIGWADPLGLARLGDFSRSQADNIKEANRKTNKGFYTCSHCGFKNKNKVFAVAKASGRPVGDGSFHADHKNPLGRGGTGNPRRNGQALGGTCNCSKGKRRKPGMT